MEYASVRRRWVLHNAPNSVIFTYTDYSDNHVSKTPSPAYLSPVALRAPISLTRSSPPGAVEKARDMLEPLGASHRLSTALRGYTLDRLLRLFFLSCVFFALGDAMAKDLTSYRLPNGLQIFVQEDHRAPVVVSQVWYKVGSSYEPLGLTGVSHALEHMMFKGTPTHGPGEFSRIIADNGGEENAATSFDYTYYYQTLDAGKLEVSFEMEADRMRHLNLDPAEFAKEIQVIQEERRMRTDDNPQSLVSERFSAAAFISTGYHHPIIGWMNDIQNLTHRDLRAWYEQWYAPNNALLVVVGDVQPNAVYELAKRYFGELKPATLPAQKPQIEVPPLGTTRLKLNVPAEVPWVLMGYLVPSLKSIPASDASDPYALAVLAGLLDGGKSSRFSERLLRGKQIAADISAHYDLFRRLDTLFLVEATPTEHHSLAELEKAIDEQIKLLKEGPISPDELARVKAAVVADHVYNKDSLSHQAEEIGSFEAIGLSWRLRDEYVSRIMSVTAEQVQKAARRYLTSERMTLAELHPLPMSVSAIQGSSSRAGQSAVGGGLR